MVYTCVVSFDRDTEIKRYRTLLAENEADHKVLTRLLNALIEDEPARLPVREPSPAAKSFRDHIRAMDQGHIGLKRVIAVLMSDGTLRDVDEVMDEVVRRNPNAKPKRVSVTNRLGDLVKEGYLSSPKRGLYELASTNGSAASVEAGGTDQAEPSSGVTPAEGEGLGSEPPGGRN